jgi:hypothetical protein
MILWFNWLFSFVLKKALLRYNLWTTDPNKVYNIQCLINVLNLLLGSWSRLHLSKSPVYEQNAKAILLGEEKGMFELEESKEAVKDI